MKELLLDAYGIDVIGFIKVSKRVYKVKTKDGFYGLKFVDNQKLEVSIEHIRTLHLECFVDVFQNKYGKIVTAYQERYFYLMPWLENDSAIVKEMKLKYYFETLAYLHASSFFNYNVSQDYFHRQLQDLTRIIDERLYYYQQIMKSYESMEFRSPSGWIYVLNYYRIEECLLQARRYLERYEELVCHKDSIRLSLVYNHFHYQHVLMKQRKLISIDNMKIDICIYDLYNMYQQVPDLLFDLDSVSIYYLDKIRLYPEEKVLLSCLLCIVPYIELEKDEVKNIVKMSRLLYYLDSITSLNKKLVID